MTNLARIMSYSFKEGKLGPDFREKDLEAVSKLINLSTSFTVVGLPAMGISIFLKYLATRPIAHFIHVDLNDLPRLSRVELFKLLYKNLSGEGNVCREEELISLCQRKLEELSREQLKTVIIFNRFDRLKQEFSQRFFANLRSCRDVDKEKIVMIFSDNYLLFEEAPQALIGGNLNMFSQTYYLKPYTEKDLERLVDLNSPRLKNKKENFSQALRLSGGHYQLLQLLLKSKFLRDKPLSDPAIKLQLKEFYEYLDYGRRKQLQRIALGKKLGGIDKFLIEVGLVKEESGRNPILFTRLLSDYIKLNLRLKLPFKELQLFQLLKREKGKIVTKEEIFEVLWPDEEGATDWALTSLIYRLRQNPTFVSSGYIIENQKKVGYSLERIKNSFNRL